MSTAQADREYIRKKKTAKAVFFSEEGRVKREKKM
jgi:hypothetical protein